MAETATGVWEYRFEVRKYIEGLGRYDFEGKTKARANMPFRDKPILANNDLEGLVQIGKFQDANVANECSYTEDGNPICRVFYSVSGKVQARSITAAIDSIVAALDPNTLDYIGITHLSQLDKSSNMRTVVREFIWDKGWLKENNYRNQKFRKTIPRNSRLYAIFQQHLAPAANNS